MTSAAKKFTAPNLMGCFEAQEEELDYWVEDIEGELPKDLTGTFYRNGPGRLKLGDQVFGHWFDGDGMIAATTFRDGKVHFRNRFVRTRKYVDETKAGKILYRGMGNMAPGGPLKNALKAPENPANTSLFLMDDTLLALWEGGHPYALDPGSLLTRGEYDFEGALRKIQPFSAHGKQNAKTRYYYNFGAGIKGFGLKGPKWCFWVYKIAPDGRFEKVKTIDMDYFPFFHDFALTEKHAVFFMNSIAFRHMAPMMAGFKPGAECLEFDNNRPCEVLVVDLENLDVVKKFELEPMAVVHFGNSFEKDGKLYVDACRTDNFEANKTLSNLFSPDFDFSAGGASYMQYEMDLGRGTIKAREISSDALPCEFPQWDWRRTAYETQYAYTAAFNKAGVPNFFNAIQKIDKKSGEVKWHDCGDYRFTGEPQFVPRNEGSAEDDGYLVSYVYDANTDRSEVMVLDARNPEDKICSVQFRHHMPQGFHGLYTRKTYI